MPLPCWTSKQQFKVFIDSWSKASIYQSVSLMIILWDWSWVHIQIWYKLSTYENIAYKINFVLNLLTDVFRWEQDVYRLQAWTWWRLPRVTKLMTAVWGTVKVASCLQDSSRCSSTQSLRNRTNIALVKHMFLNLSKKYFSRIIRVCL